jgi:proteasome assembly chaperone (PAC2) family protein
MKYEDYITAKLILENQLESRKAVVAVFIRMPGMEFIVNDLHDAVADMEKLIRRVERAWETRDWTELDWDEWGRIVDNVD